MQNMILGKVTGPSEVSEQMEVIIREIGVKEMIGLCQRVLNEREKADEWKTNVILPILKREDDIMNCESYRGVKLLDMP